MKSANKSAYITCL